MKRFMKRFVSLLLCALLLCAPAFPAIAVGYGSFQRVREYADGLFSDVGAEDWYRESVAAVYELGLMDGDGEAAFGVGKPVLIAQAVALAARLHSLYHSGKADFPAAAEGESWYRPYVAYALEQGLLDGELAEYEAEAPRWLFASILGRALPPEAMPAVNSVADGEIPDVTALSPGAAEIYRLYRAGVLSGSNQSGTFAPDTPILREAVAVALSRMAYRSLRERFVLTKVAAPQLDVMPPVGDDFFSNAAMLGNSLVDGMLLFSGLPMDFYGKTGANVFTNSLQELLDAGKPYDKVYLEFGINEIGYSTASVMEEYGKILDRIREALPEAVLYVMAVTPVTAKRDAEGQFTNRAITAFNEALFQLCAEKQCWYLDCFSPLLDDSGALAEAYAGWDGSPHLSEAGYREWAEALRTYYV